jgi:hypothetical protein
MYLMSNIKFWQHLSTPPTLIGGYIHGVHRDRDEIGGICLPSQLECTL